MDGIRNVKEKEDSYITLMYLVWAPEKINSLPAEMKKTSNRAVLG
jgi:hypothetical protein